MKQFPRYCLLSTAVLAMTVMAISVAQRLDNRAASLRSLDDWDIHELVDHLNRAGLQVQLRSTLKNGLLGQSAFLTTTDKDWEDLSSLSKFPERIQEWQGVVSCERVGGCSEPILNLLGDHCLVAGPFVFFGDAELLERIRAVLVPSAPSAAP